MKTFAKPNFQIHPYLMNYTTKNMKFRTHTQKKLSLSEFLNIFEIFPLEVLLSIKNRF